MARQISYPVIDIFAGPGGLGEGFSSFEDDNKRRCFEDALSIECDENAYSTLLLRHFFRRFGPGEVPDLYYDYLRGGIDQKELFGKHPESAESAEKSSVRLELGPENRARVSELIRGVLGKRKSWVLVGGPPCQAYSLAGRSRMRSDPAFEEDERHFLYCEYLQIIAEHCPPVFVMENVKGLLSARIAGDLTINRILEDLSDPQSSLKNRRNRHRYNLYSLSEPGNYTANDDPQRFLVRSEDFGVPQARHRILIVGVRDDISVQPGILKAHSSPTVRETISDLPAVRSGLSRQRDCYDAWSNAISDLKNGQIELELNGLPYASDVLRIIDDLANGGLVAAERSSSNYKSPQLLHHASISMLADPRLGVLTGHETRAHMRSDLQRYAYAAAYAKVTKRSPRLADFPNSLLPQHKNVKLGKEGKLFADRFRVQMPDRVSTTITSHISKDGHYFIHYDPRQCRSLTVREAARLQTFPDNYKFEGPRTAQYHQVGNAVPVYLARQIAEIIADVLNRAGEIK